MNNSHHHTSQAMGTFYFFNADAKLENNPYGFFSEFSDGNQSAMFHQQMQQQTLSINPPFPRPDSSASMPITPQTFQTTFQPHIAHINSNSMYQKPQFVNQDPVPRLMIDSTIQESDLFCFPTTPPLSASASVIGSPFLYQGLPTPINSTLFRIDNIKNNKIVPENLPLTEWVGCGSPPITPVFIQSNSLMNSTSEALPPHCQFLSPSPTPYPPPAPTHQPNFDYCDPRNLTVLPVGQISQPHIKTGPPGFSPDQTSFPANRDNSKVVAHSGLLVSDNYAKESCIPPLTVRSNQHIYDHQEEEFANGLIDYTPPSSCDSNTSKRRRSNSSSDATSLYGESFNSVAETKSLNASEVYAITCPPSPPLSISEGRAKNKKSIRKGRKTRPKNQLEAIKPIRPQNHSMGEKKEKNISGASNSRAINSSQTQIVSSDQQDAHTVDTIVPAPPTRRGRKESLTEDPSKTFGCAGCTRKFRRQEHMKRHFRSLHTSDRPFLCQECGKRFSRSDNLTQHSRTHGSGSIVMKVRKHREPSGSSSRRASTNNTIKSLGNTLYSTAAATSGSESDLSSQVSSSQALSSEFNSQSQKKRKRPA